MSNSLLSIEDLPNLPSELKKDFEKYQMVLALDTHETRGIASHKLIGELKGYQALEIGWNNVSYRLVYRIYEKPAPKRVVIVSFAEHDPAYEKAKARK